MTGSTSLSVGLKDLCPDRERIVAAGARLVIGLRQIAVALGHVMAVNMAVKITISAVAVSTFRRCAKDMSFGTAA